MLKPYDIIVILILAGLELLIQAPLGVMNAPSRLTACKSNLKNIGTAMEMYAVDHNNKYPANFEAVIPHYLKELPKCPEGGTYVVYTGKDAPLNTDKLENYYYVECHGKAHKNLDIEENLPAYSGESGFIEHPASYYSK